MGSFIVIGITFCGFLQTDNIQGHFGIRLSL